MTERTTERKAEQPNNYSVYKHTAPNGKVYIGITFRNPETRWQHGTAYKHNVYFTNAIEKYGWDNFTHEILFEGLTKEQAEANEIELIAFHKSNDRRYGYNIENGGNHNGKHSEETKRKISLAQKGKPRPESHRVKSAEEREKLRFANLGNHNAKGCHRSEKHKEILRKLKSKCVIQCDVDGKPISKFSSLAEAEKKTGISKGNICEQIHGRRNFAGGYRWKYAGM